VHFSGDRDIDKIAAVCFATGHFGDQCDLARVREAICEMSDFDINHLCLEYPGQLGHLQLSNEVLYESSKMLQLKEMLPQLIVRNSSKI
jgi:hypothetical protein